MHQGGRENTRKIGTRGERIAAHFLLQKGYEIIERNFSNRTGETDIIAWHEKVYFGRTLCFIEVKYRAVDDGSAERSVGKKKQGNMVNSARKYCLLHGIDVDHTPIQFEQVSIYGSGEDQKMYHYEIPR